MNLPDKKIIDEINFKIKNNKKFFSFEITPKLETLDYSKFTIQQPLFTSITWHAKPENNSIDPEKVPAFQKAEVMSKSNLILLHFNCFLMTDDDLLKISNSKIRNLMALRGDRHSEKQKFQHASDVVRFLRANDPSNNLCISVAGYPETHHDAISPELDLKFLKLKIDCGSDFIITQICFDSQKIIEFIRKCRKIGISVPIIPGLYQPESYKMLKSVCDYCLLEVPKTVLMEYEAVKDDEVEFQKVAHRLTVSLVEDLMRNKEECVPGVHFYTFDKMLAVVDVIEDCKEIFQN